MAIMQISSPSVTIVVPLIISLLSVPSLVMKNDARRLKKHELKPRRMLREVVVVVVAVVDDVVAVEVALAVVEIELHGTMTTLKRISLAL
jgi:hypothetical protein